MSFDSLRWWQKAGAAEVLALSASPPLRRPPKRWQKWMGALLPPSRYMWLWPSGKRSVKPTWPTSTCSAWPLCEQCQTQSSIPTSQRHPLATSWLPYLRHRTVLHITRLLARWPHSAQAQDGPPVVCVHNVSILHVRRCLSFFTEYLVILWAHLDRTSCSFVCHVCS